MKLQTLLLITATLWLVAVASLGYYRMVYAWHLGNAMMFFVYLPVFILALAVIMALEVAVFRWLEGRSSRTRS